MVLEQYTYIYVIGTFFALLDAYNNGANDVANAWATSVSSRSITYRQAIVFAFIFEILGAVAVGARTADTIKNGIIPASAFRDDAGVQMLAFTCALAGASLWVMWCSRHSAHVSSTYSLVSAVAGVGVAVAGASQVQWGWNGGKGLGAIFAGLAMAPFISACFGALMFGLIKFVVHMRRNPVPWAVYTAPLWFLIAGTICTLSIVYKGSPNLQLDKKPPAFIAAVTLGTGFGVCLLSVLFFVPYVHALVIKRDASVRTWMFVQGPFLFKRAAVEPSAQAVAPKYAVVQEGEGQGQGHGVTASASGAPILPPISIDRDDSINNGEKEKAVEIHTQYSYKEQVAQAEARLHSRLREGRGPMGWAMRFLHEHPMGEGRIYETHNMKNFVLRIPAMVVVALLYGSHYDIHAAQVGIGGTPEGRRMDRVYAHAPKYPDEVEHTYSFVQVLTACTASFAHGANDVGNAVGPWAAIYQAWSTGNASSTKAPVDSWQLAVAALAICIGLATYGYNIMKVMGNKITYHSPSRGCSMEMGAAVTILIFSQYSLPVSTSMCITGATVGVGLMNGTTKAVNWQRIALLMISWIATIPVAGSIAGVIMGVVLNAPHFPYSGMM
ncbi:phosphate transporter [Apiospora marii]|uniref:Phosphate transporter n=1 Tax=Apiospora marii TaxID=335849 RepID=A0ABR1RSN9_9PEZI